MHRGACVAEIKDKICRALGMPPLLQVLFMGFEQLCDDLAQPLPLAGSDSITLSLLRNKEPLEQDVLKALLEMQSTGGTSVADVVYFSRSCPMFSWKVLESLNTSFSSQSDIIAAILVRNSGERGARAAIRLFMNREKSHMGYWQGRRLLSNRHSGGHGTYQHWLHSFDSRRPFAVMRATQLLSQSGFGGLRAVMAAIDGTLQHAGDCQKALLLLCAACSLPRLQKSEAAVCAKWFALLLQSPSPELRVCGIICLQRIMAGNKVPEAKGIGELLRDRDAAVRHAAIVALGCLGRQASTFQEELLAQLDDTSADIRYAALVTLGGLQALARPNVDRIAKLLHDDVTACCLAALRALKCIGATTSMTLATLQEGRNTADCKLLARIPADTAHADPKMPLHHVLWRRVRPGKHMRMPDPATVQEAFDREEYRLVRHLMSTKLHLLQQKVRKLENVAQPLSKNRAKNIAKLRRLQQECSALQQAATEKDV